MSSGRTLIVGMLVAASSLAGTAPAWGAVDLGLGLRAGTHGLAADFGVGLTKWFGLRAGASFLDVSGDYEDSGIEFDGDMALGGYGAFADFYPFRGGFRLSVGFLANRNEVDLTATPTESQLIGDELYTPAEIGTIDGKIEFDDAGPYFGLGWGRFAGGKKKVGFLLDLGVLEQGSGAVTLAASNSAVDQDDLDEEAAEIEDDIEDYEYWPVVAVGLAIRF